MMSFAASSQEYNSILLDFLIFQYLEFVSKLNAHNVFYFFLPSFTSFLTFIFLSSIIFHRWCMPTKGGETYSLYKEIKCALNVNELSIATF